MTEYQDGGLSQAMTIVFLLACFHCPAPHRPGTEATVAAFAARGAANASDAAAAVPGRFDALRTALPMAGDRTVASAGGAAADSVERRRLLAQQSSNAWAGVTLPQLVRQALHACGRAFRPFSWQYSLFTSRTAGLGPSGAGTAGDGYSSQGSRGSRRLVLAAGHSTAESAAAADAVPVRDSRQTSAVDSGAALADAAQRLGVAGAAVNTLVSEELPSAGAVLPDRGGVRDGSASGMPHVCQNQPEQIP